MRSGELPFSDAPCSEPSSTGNQVVYPWILYFILFYFFSIFHWIGNYVQICAILLNCSCSMHISNNCSLLVRMLFCSLALTTQVSSKPLFTLISLSWRPIFFHMVSGLRNRHNHPCMITVQFTCALYTNGLSFSCKFWKLWKVSSLLEAYLYHDHISHGIIWWLSYQTGSK